MGSLKIFPANSLKQLYCIAFIQRTRKMRFFPLISGSVHSFTLAFDSWVMWQKQKRNCNSVLLHYAESTIS